MKVSPFFVKLSYDGSLLTLQRQQKIVNYEIQTYKTVAVRTVYPNRYRFMYGSRKKNEGSGMGGTDRKIAAACEGANTLTGKGLAIQGKVAQENQASARKSVDSWLERLGFENAD